MCGGRGQGQEPGQQTSSIRGDSVPNADSNFPTVAAVQAPDVIFVDTAPERPFPSPRPRAPPSLRQSQQAPGARPAGAPPAPGVPGQHLPFEAPTA